MKYKTFLYIFFNWNYLESQIFITKSTKVNKKQKTHHEFDWIPSCSKLMTRVLHFLGADKNLSCQQRGATLEAQLVRRHSEREGEEGRRWQGRGCGSSGGAVLREERGRTEKRYCVCFFFFFYWMERELEASRIYICSPPHLCSLISKTLKKIICGDQPSR